LEQRVHHQIASGSEYALHRACPLLSSYPQQVKGTAVQICQASDFHFLLNFCIHHQKVVTKSLSSNYIMRQSIIKAVNYAITLVTFLLDFSEIYVRHSTLA
jgi:hypothetical protein